MQVPLSLLHYFKYCWGQQWPQTQYFLALQAERAVLEQTQCPCPAEQHYCAVLFLHITDQQQSAQLALLHCILGGKKKRKKAICFQGFRVFLRHAVKSSYLQKLRHKPLLLVTQDRSNSLSSSAPRDHGLPWATTTAALEPSSSLIYVRVSKFNRASGLTSAKGNEMFDIHLGEEKCKLIATCELGLAGS